MISLVKHHCFSPQQLLASVWWRWTPAQCWNHFAPIQMERRRTPMKALSWPLVTWPLSLHHKRNKQNGSKKLIHTSRKFKVTQKMYNVSVSQCFSIPVLAPPRSAYFVCYSYCFRCLFYWNVSALRSAHHRILHHDSSSKRTYIFHSKCIEVCKTWIKIVYIYRGIWCHTRPCVKTLRSANSWMNVTK